MAGKDYTASTDVEKIVGDFAKDMNALYANIQKTKNKGKDPKKKKELFPLLTFQIGKGGKSGFRSPKLQGELLAQKKKGKTRTCWSAHMSDRARHVPIRFDGKVKGIGEINKILGTDDFNELKKNWVVNMKKHKLNNADRKKAWYKGDEFHLELEDRGADPGGKKVAACLETYVKLSKDDHERLSPSIEKRHKKDVKKIRARLNLEKPEPKTEKK